MARGGEEEGTTLEFTPTWVVAAFCTVIVSISLTFELLIHYCSKYLTKKKENQKPVLEALEKVKEELKLGFTALLLTLFENNIVKICVHEDLMRHLLPCSYSAREAEITTKQKESASGGYCAQKNKVPLISAEALHDVQIFIFVLAIVHATFSVITVVFGRAKIRQWKHWEYSISKDDFDMEKALKQKFTHVHQHEFIKGRFMGFGKHSCILGWLKSFFKQFYGSVTESDYETLRYMKNYHVRKFSFYKEMKRALEDDIREVLGISWYLWIFVVIFLFINVNGWHMYFWIAFIPLMLLLAVGTKLQHIISQLVHEVIEKAIVIEGDLAVKPSDDHFWFRRPRIILFLIHLILFQNAFEIAFFFWILFQYSFNSCIMGRVQYIVPRLIIGVIVQVLCCYSTLPLYTLVTQMGSNYKKLILEELDQGSSSGGVQLATVASNEAVPETIQPSTDS